jgi:hypothetical protein
LEEDGHQRERHADHDPDRDELDDRLAHRKRDYFKHEKS